MVVPVGDSGGREHQSGAARRITDAGGCAERHQRGNHTPGGIRHELWGILAGAYGPRLYRARLFMVDSKEVGAATGEQSARSNALQSPWPTSYAGDGGAQKGGKSGQRRDGRCRAAAESVPGFNCSASYDADRRQPAARESDAQGNSSTLAHRRVADPGRVDAADAGLFQRYGATGAGAL